MSSPQVQEVLTEWETRVAEWDPQADLERRVAAHRQRMANLREQGREVPASEEEPNDLRPGPAMDQNRPGNCYASMLGPLEGLHVKGVLFHQGYNNCFRGTQGAIMYRHVFPEMIRSWRSAFDDPQLPFGIISLCTEGAVQTLENYTEMMSNAGPYVREAQYQTFLELRQAGDANVGYVSTYDLRRRWYHPQLKIPAGERIARWALATQYGYDQQLQWKPPLLQEMQVEEGKIVLRFDDPVSAVDDGSPMLGFAIADEDRVFHPATASHLISGQDAAGREQTDPRTVVLQSRLVTQPKHYRYAWGRSPLGNVQAGRNSDIPLATQRSDDWPLEDIPAGILGETAPTLLSREQQRTVRTALQRIDLHRRRAEAEAVLQSSAE